MKAGGGWWRRRRRNWREARSTEIPGELRTTTGLRMKRRVVTTQGVAAEDDRSAGLRIGSVGVRGQLMKAHSETRLRATVRGNALPPPGTCTSTGGTISSSRQETVTPKEVFIVIHYAFEESTA